MAVIEISKIIVRRGQELQTGIPRLDAGEFGWAEDTENLYIGKRIAEGASTDENTRILTQKDYDNLFNLIRGAGGTNVASTSTYRYRDNIDWTELHSTTTTIAAKLDDTVSLTDFGVTASFTPVDIYAELNTAIQDLYNNVSQGSETVRTLKIPAGQYYVSSTINLPPQAKIVGEGAGLTTLINRSTSDSLFKTVSLGELGNVYDFESGEMQTAGKESKNITLQGLTLAFDTATNTAAMISLDNSADATIEDVHFTTYGVYDLLTGAGTGISIRGQRGTGIEQARNTKIDRCKFDCISTAIIATGTVVNSVINNNSFKFLQTGIKLEASPFAPTNFTISNNHFENIIDEALYVGASDEIVNHISTNNQFKRIGNGITLAEDSVTAVSKPVISFLSSGCKSINDFFGRQEHANTIAAPNHFYNPLVLGKSNIINNGTFSREIDAILNNFILKIALTGEDQMATIDYKLYNSSYSRKGTLIINIVGSSGFGSVSDYYDYSYDDAVWSGIDPVFYVTTQDLLGFVRLELEAEDVYNISYTINIMT